MTLGFYRRPLFCALSFIVLLLSSLPLLAQAAGSVAVPVSLAQTTAARKAAAGKDADLSGKVHPRSFGKSPATLLLQQLNTRRSAAGLRSSSAPTPARAKPHSEGAGASFVGFLQVPFIPGRQPGDTSQVRSSVTADFNGDGKADVASIQSDGTLNVFLSPAQGDFLSSGLSSTTAGPASGAYWMAVADINGDGHPDIVALDINYGGGGIGFSKPATPNDAGPNNATILIYLNDGTGKFSAPTSTPIVTPYGADAATWNIAVGDVNGDGKADVVVLSDYLDFVYEPVFTTTDITVQRTYLSAGDGTLITPATDYEFSYGNFLQPAIYQAQLADMNGDGKLDLISVMAPDDQPPFTTIQVQLGNGDGTFAPLAADALDTAVTSIPVYNGIGNLTIADVNGDGHPDAILGVNNGSDPGAVYVALNKGDGTLGPANPVIQQISAPLLASINVADVNGDGKADMLVYSLGALSVYAGNGDGTFQAAPLSQYITGYTYGLRPAPADFSGDGKVDIVDVDSTQNKIALFHGNGDGTFHGAPALGPPDENASNFQVVAVGNILGNGKTALVGQDWTHMNADFYPDLVTAASDGKSGLSYVKGLTADVLESANLSYIQPVTADLNGDGKDDLLMASGSGLSISYSNGDGTYQAPKALDFGVQLGCSVSFADAADLNGDGHADIVVAYQGDAYCYNGDTTPSGYFILLSQPDGSYKASFTPTGSALYETKLIDLNGDKKPDLVLVDNGIYTEQFMVTVVPGVGDGTFNNAGAVPVLSNYQIVSVIAGDFNADGKQDLTLTSAGQVDSSGNPLPGYPGVVLLAGNGDFTFGAPTFVDAGHTATWGSYADFNADGFPDLALADVDSTTGEPVSNLVTVMNNGDGTFGDTQQFYIYAFNPLALDTYTSYAFTGDVDGDGSADIIVTGSFNSGLYLNTAGSSLTLSVSPEVLVAGGSATVTATLLSSAESGAASGDVTFFIDGTSAGTSPITNGAATYTFQQLTTGPHTIDAAYVGDPSHNAAKVSTTISVLSVAPNFSLVANASSLTLTSRTSGALSLSLTANATFAGDVSIVCSSPLAEVSCTVVPATVTLSAGGSQTATVNITATPQAHTKSFDRKGLLGASFAAVFLLVLPIRRRFRISPVLLFAVMLGTIGMATGCSSGGSHSTPPPTQSTLTIMATSGTITQTQTISLTINHQ